MKKINIKFDNFTIEAELLDNKTANAIYDELPFEGKVNLWGNEIFFESIVNIPLEKDAKEVLEVGDLGFWPEGYAFCIFFGPTPASRDDEPKAVAPVSVFGKIKGDFSKLSEVKRGEIASVTKSE